MTAVDAVLFDLDGVLVDSRHAFATSINHALRSNGHPERAPEDLHRFLGPPVHATFEKLLGEAGDAVDACVASYRARYKVMAARESRVFDGIPETLVDLRDAGIAMVVATTKPRPIAEVLLEDLRLGHHFIAIEGPALEVRHEPKRITLARALEHLPDHCDSPIMVGDRRHDVEAAQAHDIPCIGALWGIGGVDELLAAGAEVLAESPRDLPDLLI